MAREPFPISNAEYRRRRDIEWKGTKARALRDLSNKAGAFVKAGSVVTIARKYRGFEITTADGRSMTRVAPSALAEL